jgi:hypothetical protein
MKAIGGQGFNIEIVIMATGRDAASAEGSPAQPRER